MNEDSSTTNALDVVVIGAGQAGLAIAWHLRQRGLSFVVLDAGPEVGHVWRSRWDGLRLFTPTEYDGLPGMPFPAAPGGYPTKDDVADYLASYAATFDLPVRTNSRVTSLRRTTDGFEILASGETLHAREVVVATGPFQQPFVPEMAALLGHDVVQIHSSEYRNPSSLPAGPVLVVGGGNSGLQIAEEIAATRAVTLAVGTRSPMLPQRLLGRDLFWWLTRLRLMSVGADSPIARRIRARGDLVIGTSLRRLRRRGVSVRPRVTRIDGGRVHFDDNTSALASTVVWATGYRPDYTWIEVPGVVDSGEVVHREGVTDVPGLYFLGLAWQRTRGSALLGFVGADAKSLADQLQSAPVRSSASVR